MLGAVGRRPISTPVLPLRPCPLYKLKCTIYPQSTKMEALMEAVHRMEERDPAAKAIVFSQVFVAEVYCTGPLLRNSVEN